MTAPRRRPHAHHNGMQARRLALLALFEDEFRPAQAREALERMAVEKGSTAKDRDHALAIVDGVLSNRTALDAEIARLAPAIPVSELGRVERTILRSALFEMLYSAATPSGETIHDAVSLARTYAGDAARRLVNGVLGSVSRGRGA
ncbi:MAG TPA: transcription antitermination factor NusB [Candidatus Dormibacteraeota bacterium]|nr:transcription antitermination factor NusB [Candidatus Dormibacteraeota bacterium]